MQLVELVSRVRAYTRDTTGSLFTENDIKGFINEGIDRMKKIRELDGMVDLQSSPDVPLLLPNQYHHLLAIYSASRCFTQDEQHNTAQLFMNEFEGKVDELWRDIKNGSIIIKDVSGNIITSTDISDYVRDVYFTMEGSDVDGVE